MENPKLEPLEKIKSREQAESAVQDLDAQIDKISDLNKDQKKEVSTYLVELRDKLIDMHPIPKEIVLMVEDLKEDFGNIDPNWKFEINEGNVHAEFGWVFRPNISKDQRVKTLDTSLDGGNYTQEVEQTGNSGNPEEYFTYTPTSSGGVAEQVFGDNNYEKISLDKAVSIAKNFSETEKLKFLAGIGKELNSGYDYDVAKGKQDREYIGTKKLINRIAKGKDSGAVCTQIHLAVSDIANRIGLKADTAGVASSSPHMISRIILSNGTVAFIDYNNVYVTGEKGLDHAWATYEKVQANMRLNIVSDERGVGSQVVKSEAYREKEKIMRGGGDEVDKHIEMGQERLFLKDGTEVIINNEQQEIVIKKDGWQILASHQQFDNIKDISLSHLTGVGFWKELYTKHNLFRAGISVDNEIYKSAEYERTNGYARVEEKNENEHNTDTTLSLDHTVRFQMLNSAKHRLSFANTLSALASMSLYNSKKEDGSFGNSTGSDPLAMFQDTHINDIASLGYYYIDPTSPNKFYIITGVNVEKGGDSQGKGTPGGDLYIDRFILNGAILKTGAQIQVLPGTVISGDLSAKQYGETVITEGSTGIENYKAGKLGIKAEKNFDFSDKHLVDQTLDWEVGYKSPEIARTMNVYIAGGNQAYRVSFDFSPVINRAIDRKKK